MRTLLLACLLLVPPVTAAHAQTCESQPELGTVTGAIVDEGTGLALAGAEVTLRWQVATKLEERRVTADRAGRFRLCDVPVGIPVSVHASYAGDRARAGPLRLEPGATAETRVELDSPLARVTGRILDHGTNRPIAAASVVLGIEGPTTISGEDGRFAFEGVPPGRHSVSVSHVAYTDVADTMTVELGALTNLNVRMDPNVIPLSPIEVQVRSLMLERAGFYDRQERGSGSYITRDDIEAVIPQISSDVLRRQPGLRMVQRRYGNGYAVVGRGNCPFRYFVNGARVGPTFQIDDMPVEWIEAIEIYRGASTVPIEFVLPPSAENADCGVIAIWTRNR